MHLISALIAMIKKYTISLRAKNHQGLFALKLIENENKKCNETYWNASLRFGRLGSSPSVSTFFPISKFSYFVIRFLNHIFLSLTFPISLSDFTELLSKNLITK